MSQTPGPYDAYGRPQDSVPGDSEPHPGGPAFDPMQQGARGGGFRAFPFPSYSTRTRRGTNVTVAGCCLPLPLGCLVTVLSVSGVAVAAAVRGRR